MLIQRNFSALQTRAVSQGGLRGVADIARDLQGVLVTSIICSVVYFKVKRRVVVLVGMVPLQVMMEAYEAYLDPLASMLYIVILIWTCVPLVRYSTPLMNCTWPALVPVLVLLRILVLVLVHALVLLCVLVLVPVLIPVIVPLYLYL